MKDGPIVSLERAKAAVQRALTIHVGRGRRWSVKEVEAGTGVPGRVIYAYLGSNEGVPQEASAAYLLSLMAWLGVEFANTVMVEAGYRVVPIEDDDLDPAEIIPTTASATAEAAQRGIDGEYCPKDRTALAPIADKVVALWTPLTSKARVA